MITVLQTLPVASSDAVAAPGNTAQDGAENGFSQMFAAARAASDKPTGGGKGGNAASSGGSGLPPASAGAAASTSLAGTAEGAEPVVPAWSSFALVLETLATGATADGSVAEEASLPADAAAPVAQVVDDDASASGVPLLSAGVSPGAVGGKALPAQLPSVVDDGAPANSGSAVEAGISPPPGLAAGAVDEVLAGTRELRARAETVDEVLAGTRELPAGAETVDEVLAGTRELPARAEKVAAATGSAIQEVGILAAAERARGDDAAALQVLRQRAVEGGPDTLRLAVAAGNAEPAAATTPVTAAAQGAAANADVAAPTAPRAPAQLAMTHAPQDPEFTGELANRLQVFARNGGHEATLQLHPADLGRLQVSITTDGDQARVLFVADSAAARDAIEQSLPRLREMLAQSGLQLAHSDVSGQSQGSGDSQRDASGLSRVAAADDSGSGSVSGAAESGDALGSASVRLVDYYI
ncbi:MAG: flagellar hook-length control protein FliK [Haliea sp.]|uniref:flagellar hook-length control protein FliK n=1 Tax=Haliea sp. TaxID=1932666 RepID=UPI0032EBDD48